VVCAAYLLPQQPSAPTMSQCSIIAFVFATHFLQTTKETKANMKKLPVDLKAAAIKSKVDFAGKTATTATK